MSGHIRVTPAELVDMANRYGQKGVQVNDVIQELDSMSNQLQDMWEGASSEAFRAQYEELRPSFMKMVNLLEDINKQLNSTAQALEDADRNIASQIRG